MVLAVGPDAHAATADLRIGDPVYAADDISLSRWSHRPVAFSAGTGRPASPGTMLRVGFGEPDAADHLVVSRSQLFLTPGGLKPAACLVPGQDRLRTSDGGTKPVVSLDVGTAEQGPHHVATGLAPATSVDGHLLSAKGAVVADFALQVALSTPDGAGLPLVEGLQSLPEFGTPAYAKAYPALGATAHRAAVPGYKSPQGTDFAALADEVAVLVPPGAFAFLTPEQAADVAAKGEATSVASEGGRDTLNHLFKLFGAFYPYITFSYDAASLVPNGYIFADPADPQKYDVVVTGGLVRLPIMTRYALASVIATLVGATTSGPPKNDLGLSCLGTASYGGVGGVLTTVWPGLEAGPVIKEGIAQTEALFDLISAENKGGSDTCMGVSCDCRLLAMRNALAMLPLPGCAGTIPLAVISAAGTVRLPHGTVEISFNLPLDPKTTTDPANYAFDPPVETSGIAVQPYRPSRVTIEAVLTAATAYTVTVSNVVSDTGQPLDPEETTATFTTA